QAQRPDPRTRPCIASAWMRWQAPGQRRHAATCRPLMRTASTAGTSWLTARMTTTSMSTTLVHPSAPRHQTRAVGTAVRRTAAGASSCRTLTHCAQMILMHIDQFTRYDLQVMNEGNCCPKARNEKNPLHKL